MTQMTFIVINLIMTDHTTRRVGYSMLSLTNSKVASDDNGIAYPKVVC